MFGSTGVFATSFLQVIVYLCIPSFWPYEILTFLMLIGLGFILTSATTLAMDEGRQMIGTASAIFGASGFLFGGIVSPLVGIGNIMSTTLLLISICALLSLVFATLTFRRKPA